MKEVKTSTAYFVTKTGKIKNPYTMSNDETNEIIGRGPHGNGGLFKHYYATDGVGGTYNQQFIKIGTNEFDMELVKSEMEIQPGNEPTQYEKMYLCDAFSNVATDEIISFNNDVKNNFNKIQDIFGQEVSSIVNRKNIYVEVISLKTISYAKQGCEQCNDDIEAIVKIPAQQDIPELVLGMTMQYFNFDSKLNKTFHIIKSTTDKHKDSIERLLIGYFGTVYREKETAMFYQRVEVLFKEDYIFTTTQDRINWGVAQFFPNYVYGNGMETVFNQVTGPIIRKFIDQKVKPTPTELKENAEKHNPKFSISIRPTKESEIVDFPKLEALTNQIKEIGKDVFGQEIQVGIQALGQFKVVQHGVSKKIMRPLEMYVNYSEIGTM